MKIMVKHETETWGSLEELLLAYAVNRHGTSSWDSVSLELQNRFSPHDCRNKFHDLKRRFISLNDNDMLHHLKNIRLHELRRDVQRRDLLISSLEMKVKKLEAEADADLNGDKTENQEVSDDRENRSLNESNSTSKKEEEKEEKTEPAILLNKETGPDRTEDDEPGKEWSFNGVDKIRKEKRKREKGREKEKTGDSNDAWESVRESKEERKQRSSGSLSEKKRFRKSGGGGGGDRSNGEESEAEGDEISLSPAKERQREKLVSPVKSEPLVKFLEMIRSHRLGSLFERRLRSQESEKYKKLIRIHVDLRTIHSRIVKGVYKNCIHRFFRDVLLVFNNAIIFFPKSSSEYIAALELRPLVLKEMKHRIPNPQSINVKPQSRQEHDMLSKPFKSSSSTVVAEVSSRKREVDEKKVSNVKIYEKGTWKKGTKEGSRPGPRIARMRKSNGEVKHEYGGNELSSHDGMEVRVEKKKKKGAASFLKRMKQNSPTDEDSDVNVDVDVDVSEEESVKEEEERKIMSKQKQARRERVTRNGGGRGSGRGLRRPPKKAEPVKKRRDEVAAGNGNGVKPRKRSRR